MSKLPSVQNRSLSVLMAQAQQLRDLAKEMRDTDADYNLGPKYRYMIKTIDQGIVIVEAEIVDRSQPAHPTTSATQSPIVTNKMTLAEKRKLLSNLSKDQIDECARQIAHAGEEDYLPDHFERTFGPEAEVLAGLGYTNQLAPALKKLGFAISLKMFPGNKKGCSVHRL